MNTLKATMVALCLTLFFSVANAQDESKDITIKASGSGKTLEDAKQAALRSSTQQAFGAFISSKTEIFNDQLVADQMASVSSGNIKSYELLNESQLPDGSWGVTLKVLVSISKLTSFVEAKGIAIEIKGGMFALNIKQQLLNEQGEIAAVCEMVGLLHEPMQISFDYVIKSSEPKSLDTESKNWEIPLKVTATANKNMDFCANYCIKTLKALSLSEEEVANYKSLNKAVFPVKINYKGFAQTFYLRKIESLTALNTLLRQWFFYTSLFTVQSGMDEFNGNFEDKIKYPSELYIFQAKIDEKKRQDSFIDTPKIVSEVNYYNFGTKSSNNKYNETNIYELANARNFGGIYLFDRDLSELQKLTTINFLSEGNTAAVFTWQDQRTLSQIEQMTGYNVKPNGVVSQFKHGGIVVYENNGHGLVAAILNLGFKKNGDYNEDQIYAKTLCEGLKINGYGDWRLPKEDEFLNHLANEKVFRINLFGQLQPHFRGTQSSPFSINQDKYGYLNRYEHVINQRVDGIIPMDSGEIIFIQPVRTF
jgi:hypothetical protein